MKTSTSNFTAAECLSREKNSFIKARRTYMRVRKWREDDWYAAWPAIAAEWEEAAAAAPPFRRSR